MARALLCLLMLLFCAAGSAERGATQSAPGVERKVSVPRRDASHSRPGARPRPTLAFQVGHSGAVSKVAFSPDGKTLVTEGLDDGTVRLWDPGSGQLRVILRGQGQFRGFSPDGEKLATSVLLEGTSQDQVFRWWDAADGQFHRALRLPAAGAVPPLLSPDGRLLATWGAGRTVRVWNAQDGDLRMTFQAVPPGDGPAGSGAVELTFSPDGRTLATAYRVLALENGAMVQYGSEARLWRLEDAEARLLAILPGHAGPVTALAFSPDGKTLATGSGGGRGLAPGEARLWDGATGQLQAVLQGHTRPVQRLAFSPDGRLLATGAMSIYAGDRAGEVRIWDAQTGQMRAALEGHEDKIADLAFSPDGRMLASASRDATARLWDAATGRLRGILRSHSDRIWSLDIAPGGHTLATCSADNSVRLWKMPDKSEAGGGEPKRILAGHTSMILAGAISPDRRELATGSEDGTARVWDLQTGRLRLVLPGHPGLVWDTVFSPDGRLLAAGSGGGGPRLRGRNMQPAAAAEVRLWDIRTGRLEAVLAGHTDWVARVVFSPGGKILATGGGSRDPTVRLWDLPGGQLRAVLRGHTSGEVRTLIFSPDGRRLATGAGYGDASVRLWDVETGRLLAALPRLPGEAVPEFSPDGSLLALANGPEVRLWELPASAGAGEPRLRATLQGLEEPAWALCFSPDGKTVAASGWGRDVVLWDSASGKVRVRLPARLPVRSLAFLAGGVLAGSSGTRGLRNGRLAAGAVMLWEVTTGRELPVTVGTPLASLPAEMAMPFSSRGAGVELQDPRDGRTLVMLLPVPEAAPGTGAGRPIEVGARPIEVGARPIEIGSREAPVGSGAWFAATPEGYFDCSVTAPRFVHWNLNGVLYPAERYLRRFWRPDLVRRALRGEKIAAAAITGDDIPPSARFAGLPAGGRVLREPLELTVEVRGEHPPVAVELLINGRPPAPAEARPVRQESAPSTPGAHRDVRRFTFRVRLPRGAGPVRLRAVAVDAAGLGSEPSETVVTRTAGRAERPDLYLLSVGVSRYLRGGFGGQFGNLSFSAADARAMAKRFEGRGGSLYGRVRVRALTDEQATLANVRASLAWLRQSVQPSQIDTVCVYLSGHGFSSPDGRYFFAPYDFDLQDPERTGLSARALRAALGGALRAAKVLLLVDTCHAGALGSRNDHLAIEIGSGVYLLTSSGAGGHAYESRDWKHGAFTLALLRALCVENDRPQPNGLISFRELEAGVRAEVAALLEEADQNVTAQEPCSLAAGLDLDAPVATASGRQADLAVPAAVRRGREAAP
jgi:WD40 repeat protein